MRRAFREDGAAIVNAATRGVRQWFTQTAERQHPIERQAAMSIDCTVADGVATILLNRPDKLNALTHDMWEQLEGHLDRCQRDDAVRAIILTGAGRAFCAGADISGEGRKKDMKTG